MKTVDHAADEHVGEPERLEPLGERVQEALSELAGAAKEGLLALSVGVGLGVLAEIRERPRARTVDGEGEGELETYRHFADRDPLTDVMLERMLAQGQQEHSLHLDGSPREVARGILSGLEGAMLVARSYDDTSRFDAAANRLLATLTEDGSVRVAARR